MQFIKSHAYIAQTYLGKTKRRLLIRCDEHKKNINVNEKYYNVDTKHRVNNKNYTGMQHDFDCNNIKILRIKFRIVEFSDFLQTSYTYVF